MWGYEIFLKVCKQLTLEDDHRVPDKVDEAEPAALAQAPLQEVHRAGSADLSERVSGSVK